MTNDCLHFVMAFQINLMNLFGTRHQVASHVSRVDICSHKSCGNFVKVLLFIINNENNRIGIKMANQVEHSNKKMARLFESFG